MGTLQCSDMFGGRRFDVCVIGAGIEGSAIAYTLVKNGLNTAMVEQFFLPHTRGSSHGQSRLIRAAYGNDDYMTRMMVDSYQLWRQLELESRTQIVKKTGLLVISPPGCDGINVAANSLTRYHFPHRILTQADVDRQYPAISMKHAGHKYLLDEEAGALNATRALTSYQRLFVQKGGELVDGCPVLDIKDHQNDIEVITTRGVIRCDKLCLAAGSWTNKVLEPTKLQLPLKPKKVVVTYWPLKAGKSMAGYPGFIYVGSPEVYMVMGNEYPGHVKVCPHAGTDANPDERDVGPSSHFDDVQRFVEDNLPYLEPKPSIMETCMYTETPDHCYIIDKHPRHNKIFIAAGFSGHGFKMAPIVGKILHELITDIACEYDLSHFRIDRFTKSNL